MSKKDSYWFLEASRQHPKIKMGYVYLLRFDRWYKIGITNNLKTRFNAFRFGLPSNDFEMVGFTACEKNGAFENGVLFDMSEYRTRGEWMLCEYNDIMEVIAHWCGVYGCEFITPKSDE